MRGAAVALAIWIGLDGVAAHAAPADWDVRIRRAEWGVPHRPFTTIHEALADIAASDGPPRTVLIAGTLYLAGQVLTANDQPPV